MCFNFVVKRAYENYLTKQISQFMVHIIIMIIREYDVLVDFELVIAKTDLPNHQIFWL